MLLLILILLLIPVLIIVFMSGNAWLSRTRTGGESWRDRPPLWLQLARPFVNILITPLRATYGDKFRNNPDTAQKIETAGLTYAIEPDELLLARWTLSVFVVVIGVWIYSMFPSMKTSHLMLLVCAIPVGYFYPDIWLNDTAKRRKHSISKDFPFFLELLVLSMRAGLNFSSAVAHAAEKMREGPLREEVEKYIRAMRTGQPRREALHDMAKRISLPQVSNFVAAVAQAEEVGGELGDLLTKQAAQRRKERFLRAEELANKAPVKMLLPLIGILFPMTFVIIGFTLYIKARDSGALDFMTS